MEVLDPFAVVACPHLMLVLHVQPGRDFPSDQQKLKKQKTKKKEKENSLSTGQEVERIIVKRSLIMRPDFIVLSVSSF
ncbi:hypothetical protein K1719_031164 [Acacia pycnantha]|nr:hypothetical protein K1719_031164 [Acacia pycnantha]